MPRHYRTEQLAAETLRFGIRNQRGYIYYCMDHESYCIGIDTGAKCHEDRTSCTATGYYGDSGDPKVISRGCSFCGEDWPEPGWEVHKYTCTVVGS